MTNVLHHLDRQGEGDVAVPKLAAENTRTWQKTLSTCSSFVKLVQPLYNRKVENVSANQTPGQPSCLTNRQPEKHGSIDNIVN